MLACAITCCPALARAQAAAPRCTGFGCAGAIVPSGDFGGTFSIIHQADDPALGIAGGAKLDAELWVAPALQWFALDRIAFGLELNAGLGSQRSGLPADEQHVGAGVGAGGYLAFGPRAGWFPLLWLTGSILHEELTLPFVSSAYVDPAFAPARGSAHLVRTERMLRLRLELPVVIHLAEHVFAGVGPYGSVRALGNAAAIEDKLLGLSTRIGVWW